MRARRPLGALGWLALAACFATCAVVWTVHEKWIRVACEVVTACIVLAWAFSLCRRLTSPPDPE